MHILYEKVSLVGIGFILVMIVAQVFGYEDANIWRYANSSMDLYTVPSGQYFWLYGMLFNNATGSADLEVDGNTFFDAQYEGAYRFYPPIKFPSGTIFTASVSTYGSIMMYGYEGTSNFVNEHGLQRSNFTSNPSVMAHPIPFSNNTSIHYNVHKKGNVSIKVYDEAGRLVRTLVETPMDKGSYTARWDGRDSKGTRVSDGSYFGVVKTNGTSTTKLIFIK